MSGWKTSWRKVGRKERCKNIDGGDEFEDQLDTGEEPKRFIVTYLWVLMNMLSLMNRNWQFFSDQNSKLKNSMLRQQKSSITEWYATQFLTNLSRCICNTIDWNFWWLFLNVSAESFSVSCNFYPHTHLLLKVPYSENSGHQMHIHRKKVIEIRQGVLVIFEKVIQMRVLNSYTKE